MSRERYRYGRMKTYERRKSPKTYPSGGLATREQAAEFLNCKKGTITSLINRGVLAHVMIGRKRHVPWHSLWAAIGRPVHGSQEVVAMLEECLKMTTYHAVKHGVTQRQLIAAALRYLLQRLSYVMIPADGVGGQEFIEEPVALTRREKRALSRDIPRSLIRDDIQADEKTVEREKSQEEQEIDRLQERQRKLHKDVRRPDGKRLFF